MSSCHCSDIAKRLAANDARLLLAACEFGRKHLGHMKRRSGESYSDHGCRVAATLAEVHAEAGLLAVAVLHDLPVHPNGKALLQVSPLSSQQRALVKSMQGLRRLHINSRTKDLDTVIHAFSEYPSLLPLRMAHRLSDLRILKNFDKSLRQQIASESLHMYSSIAARLGMQAWRREMEETCFHELYPRIAKRIGQRMQQQQKLDISCLLHAKKFILRRMKERSVHCRVEYRIKSSYSTYRKMMRKDRRFDELTDRLALRIIVKSQDDCYRTLGLVHSLFHPIPGKIKDYIGLPKENGYRSIHTVVYPLAGVTEQPIEIQIRTEDMDRDCEYGIARHWSYKDASYALSSRSARVDLFRSFLILRQESSTPKRFEEVLRTYFREDHMVLFDAKNNVYHLRKPATALDFACSVAGNKCRTLKTVRLNGREVPLDSPLHDGDTVEPTFSHQQSMHRSWLQFCRHASSRKLLEDLLNTHAARS